VTNFARTPARAAGHSRRPLVSSLLAALAASCACAFSAAPAGAVVTPAEQGPVGLQPRTTNETFPSGSFSNENGNAVVDGANVYVVYWDPGAWYHPEWVANIDGFMQDLGASSGGTGTIFAALSQYRDRANSPAAYKYVFKGSYSDTAPYPAKECTDPEGLEVGQIGCVTDTQVREQLQSFILGHGTPKGMNSIYYVLTPPGVAVCLDKAATACSDFAGAKTEESYKNSFCSYHGDINPESAAEGNANTILYATIPWTAGYEGHPWDFAPGLSNAGQATDCQAGGPHVQEPNQNGRGEEGDYASGLSDLIVGQIAAEQANVVTDPLLTSWQNLATGNEATDECRNVFSATAAPSKLAGSAAADPNTEAGTLSNETIGNHNYYINNIIDIGALHRSTCVGGLGLVPRFTSPNPVKSEELVDFDGMGSTVSEFERASFALSGPPTTTYATFAWNFGDGTPEVTGFAPGAPKCEAPWLSPCAGSTFHAYTYGGIYNVTLTVTDVGGNVSQVTHQVSVAGPPPPSPSVSSGTGSPGSSPSGSSTGTGTGSGSGSVVIPKPTAAAAIAKQSLRNALRKGIAVRYSVNEKVTGHFEVLIASALAHKLGITGAPASGLPAGTPPQLVIGRAVLVTTKGGTSTIRVKLSKKTSSRLKHVHSVPLMLRFVVRNASAGSPSTATVLSSLTLAG
jgi:hypothetical protein